MGHLLAEILGITLAVWVMCADLMLAILMKLRSRDFFLQLRNFYI